MIRDSSAAINDCAHTSTLTCGHHHHSHNRAQSWVCVGLLLSFGTIIKPTMNVFDCRWQIKASAAAAAGSPPLSSDAVASDTFNLSVMLCHVHSWSISVSYRCQLRAKNRHIGIGWKWRTRSNTSVSYIMCTFVPLGAYTGQNCVEAFTKCPLFTVCTDRYYACTRKIVTRCWMWVLFIFFAVSRCRFGRCSRTNNSRRRLPHHSASSVPARSCSSAGTDASALSVPAITCCNDQTSSGSWPHVCIHCAWVSCSLSWFVFTLNEVLLCLSLHHLSGTLYLYTFVLLTSCQPSNAN